MKLLVLSVLLVQSCISLPDVYVVDQATVLEEEAAGHWPEMEKVFRESAKKPPQVLEDVDKDKRTVYKILNGNMSKKGKL